MTEMNGHSFHSPEEYEEENFLTDELDHEILMHREVHFGGSFDEMLQYYEEEKRGVHPDFEIERIEYLAGIEKETGKDLAPLILTGAEAEMVARARKIYQDFKLLYEQPRTASHHARLIADLVLTEEEEPVAEIEEIVEEGSELVPALIRIIKSDEAYDALFPGYGYAPELALLCLAKLKDPSAIIPIFETLSREPLFGDEAALMALREIGEPAKEFLLKRVSARPLTRDNLSAAYALSVFDNDEKIAQICFEQLKDPQVQQNGLLAAYLLLPCEQLKEREPFIQLSKQNLPRDLKIEMERIVRAWEK